MSEPKRGPFDAEDMLEHLREGCLWDTRARDEFREKYPRSIYTDDGEKPCPICDRVAAILEAAGGMDVTDCLRFLERINEDGEMRDEQGLLLFPLAQIRNLLRKALPDKEEK